MQIIPQTGFQTQFLSTSADIAIGGGSAGAGKSYGLLLEALRHVGNRGFRSVIFRRTMPQIKNSGGLWDTSKEIYLKLRGADGRGPASTESPPKWIFPSGATVLFSHLEQESNKYDWDGSQIALLGFDELIHFSESQFWYLVGRNRSASGVRPYIRATTNPQKSGWVKRLVGWWIYPDDYEAVSLRGMPIPERAGVVRYLARYNERQYWGDTPENAIEALPEEGKADFRPELVKSVTFIPGTLSDNVALLVSDPSYKGNLLAQDQREGARLLRGCWYDSTGEHELFSYEALLDVFSNSFVASGERYLAVDVAMDGRDLFTIGYFSGLRLEKVYSYSKKDGKEIWQIIERTAREHEVPRKNIVFDTNGIGNFLKGFFRSSFDFRSQSAPLPDAGVKLDYQNLRTQCIYKLAEIVTTSKLYIQCESDAQRDYIMQEFEAHKRSDTTVSGKLTVTSKEAVKADIKRSPDVFDLLLMRMVFEVQSPKRSGWLSDDYVESTP